MIMIKRSYFAALPLLLGGAMAEAQIAPKDASYFCVAENGAWIDGAVCRRVVFILSSAIWPLVRLPGARGNGRVLA
jgi:hypothetical protein